MNLFIIAAVILTGLAVAIVIRPLLRKEGDVPAAPVAAVILGLALPAAVLVIYLSASNHDWLAPAPRTDMDMDGGGAGMPDIDKMVAQLETRLQAEPNDIEGWLMLGRTYARLRQPEESRRAYRQALTLEPRPEAKLGLAEAEIMLDQNSLMGDAGRLIEEVLEAEPQNPKALFYGGMAAMARKDVDTLRDRWQRLLTMSPPDEIRDMIEKQLAQLDDSTGQTAQVVQENGITVNISVSAELAEQIDSAAVLYLIARDPNRPGPPLAVIRQDARVLPVELNISDDNAMMPGLTLTSLPQVQLVARITTSGEPVAQPGDLFGETVWSSGGKTGEGTSIVIDRIVD